MWQTVCEDWSTTLACLNEIFSPNRGRGCELSKIYASLLNTKDVANRESYKQGFTFASVCQNQVSLKLLHFAVMIEIDSHTWMLRESLQGIIMWLSISSKVKHWQADQSVAIQLLSREDGNSFLQNIQFRNPSVVD